MHHHVERPTHIHWNILTWNCADHGPHRVIVAGLDDTADLVAEIIMRQPTKDSMRPHLHTELIPLDDARTASYGEVDHEDIQF